LHRKHVEDRAQAELHLSQAVSRVSIDQLIKWCFDTDRRGFVLQPTPRPGER
jgi:hypothetical protein